MASLADAEEVLRSTNAKANFQRLTRLLMCGGLRLLRETFDSIHSPADLPVKLSDPAVEAQLRGARLTRPERKCLYPSAGVYGKSTDFDITLIFRLLRTICGLTPPPGPRGWDDLPNSSDHSFVADLVRIKYYRNEVYGHKKFMEISDLEFDDLWRKISEALIRIAANISPEKRDEWKKAIDDFRTNPLTPEEERCVEELERWYKQDMDVKNELEKLGDTMEERLTTLTEDIRVDHGNIQEEVRSLRQEMQQYHRPVSPVFIAGPVVIQIVNTVESVTQAGSRFQILSHPAGRPQLAQASESRRRCIIPIQPDHEQSTGAEGPSGEPQPVNQRDPPMEIEIWDVILSAKQTITLFFQYLRYKRDVFVRNHGRGSLLLTVECRSLQILEELWGDYRSGHLSAIAQEILVTAEVLEKLGLDEVKLNTFISEEEFEKGKHIFAENSDYLLRISKLERENTQLIKEVEALKQKQERDKDTREDEKRQEARRIAELQGIIIKLSKIMGASIDELKDHVRRLEVTTTTKRDTKQVDPLRYSKLKKYPEQETGQEGVLEAGSGQVKNYPERESGKGEVLEAGSGRLKPIPFLEASVFEFTESLQRRLGSKRAEGPITIIEEPTYWQEAKEGLKVELVFKCKANDNSELFYQWFKGITELHGKSESVLVINSVRLSDFGRYRCRAICKDSPSDAVSSSHSELDVIPRDGTRYKYLSEVDPFTKHRVGLLLKQIALSGWRRIATKYGMNELGIMSLSGDPEAGSITLEYLNAVYPYLTVYDFCKTLEDDFIWRHDVVKELLGHLSVPA